MRTEIGVHPWAHLFIPYCDGVKLEDCTMADEEMGCAEVYADVEVMPNGSRLRLANRKRMVFGKIEDHPLDVPVAHAIRAAPERAQEIWDEYYLPRKAQWEAEDRRWEAEDQAMEAPR